MTLLDDFFAKKKGSTGSTVADASSSTDAVSTGSLDDFFAKKKRQKSIVDTPDAVTDNSTGISASTDTTEQAQKIEEKRKLTDEELRIKQIDLVMGAEQVGKMFIDQLNEEDQKLLIEGLKTKKMNKDIDYRQRETADKTLSTFFPETTPTISAVDPNEKRYTKEEIIADRDTAAIPFMSKMTQQERNDYTNELIALGPDLDPQNPSDLVKIWEQADDKDFQEKIRREKEKRKQENQADDPMENVGIALEMGVQQVKGTAGAIREWIGGNMKDIGIDYGLQEEGRRERKRAETLGQLESTKFNQEIAADDNNVLDSRFWTQKVPQSIPAMVALAPAGFAGMGIGGAVAGRIGLGALGSFLTKAGFAGLTSRFAEGIMEGSETYSTLIDAGLSDDDASRAAWKTTEANMALVFSDITQMAVTFAPISKIPGAKNLLGKALITGGKFIIDGASEGAEEVYQGYVQHYNALKAQGGTPMGVFEYMQSDEARSAFTLGAATGLAFAGAGVVKDGYDNFTNRIKAQVGLVDEAIEKSDTDFIDKMQILEQKGVITKRTLDATQELLSLKLNERGQTYKEWKETGDTQRRQSIEETALKLKDLATKIDNERKTVAEDPGKVKFKNATELNSFFMEKTGMSVEAAKMTVAGIKLRNEMRKNGNPAGPNNTLEMEKMPFTKDQLKLIQKYDKIKNPSSKYLFHTTRSENIESIKSSGLLTGQPTRYEDTSPSSEKLYFSGNEEAAKYFGSDTDVILRVSKKYKFNDIGIDYLGGGDGTYESTDNIPPEYLEIKEKGKWIPLVNKKQDTQEATKGEVVKKEENMAESPQLEQEKKAEEVQKKEVSKGELEMMKRDYKNFQELYKKSGEERHKVNAEKELEKIRQVEPDFAKVVEDTTTQDEIMDIVDKMTPEEKLELEADYRFDDGTMTEKNRKIAEEIMRREDNIKKVMEDERQTIQNEYKKNGNGENYETWLNKYLKEYTKKFTEAIAQLGMDIENSEAGKRIFARNEDAVYGDGNTSVTGLTIFAEPSTFPNWIPEHLRSKKLMQDTYTYLINNTIIPKRNTRMRELADVFYQHLDPNLFIYGDEQGRNLTGTAIRKKLDSTAESTTDQNIGSDNADANGSESKNDATISKDGNDEGSSRAGTEKQRTGTSKSGINNAIKKVEELVSIESKTEDTEDKTVQQKVEEELNKDEKTKQYKDIGERVAGSKKENAKYRILSQEDLAKVESESEAQAFQLVTKERVVQDPYDPVVARDKGEDAGIAYYKTKLWSSIQKKPGNSKESRAAYLRILSEVDKIIKEAKTIDDIQDTLTRKFKRMYMHRGFGYIDENINIDAGKEVLGEKFFNIIYRRTDAGAKVLQDALKYQGITKELKEKMDAKKMDYLKRRVEYAKESLLTIKPEDSRYGGMQRHIEDMQYEIDNFIGEEITQDDWTWLESDRKKSEGNRIKYQSGDTVIKEQEGKIMYRGQIKSGNEVQYNDTKFQGNAQGGVFFIDSKDIARKYGNNIIEIRSTKDNTVSIEEGNKLQKMAEKIVEDDVKKQKETDELIEQMALGRPKAFAKYTGKAFVETGDIFGESNEMIFYKEFYNEKKNQGSESNTWIYDIVGSQYKTHPYSKQKIDISESYEEAMKLAPDGWEVRVDDATIENSLKTQDGAEMVAYADLENKVIMINKNEARKSTAAHESVHARLSEIGDKERRQIMNAGKKQWEGVSGKSLDDNQVEEFIAEEFKYYIENQKYKTKNILGKLREFIYTLANKIKGMIGMDNKIKTLYDDILQGKIKKMDTSMGKKYQSAEEYKKRASEEYDKIDAENFGYKLPPKLGPEFDKGEIYKAPAKGWESFKEFGEAALVPIDSRIGAISQEIKDRLGKFEYDMRNNYTMQQSRPILESLHTKLKKIKGTDDYRILDTALKNGNKEVTEYYEEKLGISEEMKKVREILDRLHSDANEAGINVRYLADYFPRMIGDSKGLLGHLYKTEWGSRIKEAIRLQEQEANRELTEDEKAVIANKLLMGYRVSGIKLLDMGNAQERKIKVVTKELSGYYKDSFDSLTLYIQGMSENIETRKFFGQVYSNEEKAKMKEIKRKTGTLERYQEEIEYLEDKLRAANSKEYIKRQTREMKAKEKQIRDYLEGHTDKKKTEKIKDLEQKKKDGKITEKQEEELQKLKDYLYSHYDKEKFTYMRDLQKKIWKNGKILEDMVRLEELRDKRTDLKKWLESDENKEFYRQVEVNGRSYNLQDSVGAWTLRLIEQGKITPDQEADLAAAIKSRFADNQMHQFLQNYKSIAYLTTMGSPVSTLSQIQDIGVSLYANGWWETGKAWTQAMARKSKFKKADFGIDAMMFEFTEQNKLATAVSKVFKWVGLEYLDSVGKETMINGAYRRIQKQIEKGDISALRIFDDETKARVAAEIKADLVSDEIRYLLFTELMKFQPITKSQMPEYYNTQGNARIAYMLKTYLIKQIDVLRQEGINEAIQEAKKGNAKKSGLAAGRVLYLAFCLALMGMGSDALKNLLLNRPFDVSDMVVDNIFKLLGFSKYTIYQVKEGTLSDGMLSIILPPFNFFNDPIKDYYYFTEEKKKNGVETGEKLHEWDWTKLQSINNIPLGGKLFYWWYGMGADKSEKKRTGGKSSESDKPINFDNPFK